MHIVFQLHGVHSFDCTVFINVLINISYLKLNNRFSKFRSMVHEYVSQLTTTPKS